MNLMKFINYPQLFIKEEITNLLNFKPMDFNFFLNETNISDSLKNRSLYRELFDKKEKYENILYKLEFISSPHPIMIPALGGFKDIITIDLRDFQLEEKFQKEIKGWNKDTSTFRIPEYQEEYTISDIIKIVANKFGIEDFSSLKFWSPNTEYIEHGSKYYDLITGDTIDIDYGKTLYSKISSTGGLLLVYDSSNNQRLDPKKELLNLLKNYKSELLGDKELMEFLDLFVTSFSKTMRNNPDNFIEIFKNPSNLNLKNKFPEFIFNLKLLVDETFSIFQEGGFEAIEQSLIYLWLKSGTQIDPDLNEEESDNLIYDAKSQRYRVQKIYDKSLSLHISNPHKYEHPDQIIKKSILKGIIQNLYDSPSLDGIAPYMDTVPKDKTFERLIENLEFSKNNNYFRSREFLSISVLMCLTSNIMAFRPRKFGIVNGLDSDGELEVFSLIEIMPREHQWLEKYGFTLKFYDEVKLHDKDVENNLKSIKFGPARYIVPSSKHDSAYFDVGRRFYSNKDGDNVILYIPNKNSITSDKETINGIVDNTLRAIYETHNSIVESNSMQPTNTKSFVLLVGPFLSQDEKYNTLNSFSENFLFQISNGVNLGEGCWQENRPRSSDLKLSISDGHKKVMINTINDLIGFRENTNEFSEFKEDFLNNFGQTKDNFIIDLNSNNQEKLKNYWGITHDKNGKRKFGLVLEGSIRMYMDTEQLLITDKIKKFLDKKEGLKGLRTAKIVIEGVEYEYISEATALGFKMDNNGNPSYRIFSLEQLALGLPKDSEWQVGYTRLIHYNEITKEKTYELIPQVIITNYDGHKLLSRYNEFKIDSKSGIIQLIDNGPKWFMNKDILEKNILKDFRDINYGIKTNFFEVKR